MAVNLSTFLGTSLNTGLDSAGVKFVVEGQGVDIPLDSNTVGNYVKTITDGGGLVVVNANAHAASLTMRVDSSEIATLATAQTLTNKTINLSNNSLTGTLGQYNAALSGASFASLNGIETFTNKTLTSPVINSPDINGPGSINKISTFGLRDASTPTYEMFITSNSSPNLSADRTLTLDVNNGSRTMSINGDILFGGAFTTSGSHATTLTTSGTTNLTLPTSGTLVSKNDSGDFSANIITADLVGDVTGNITGTVSDISNHDTDDLSEGSTNLYHTTTRVRDAVGVSGSYLNYSSAAGTFSLSASEVMKAMLTMDSDNSGLNADTLDGQEGSYYRIDVYNASGTLLN